jgi:ubiquinone biosynthesis protein COQ9
MKQRERDAMIEASESEDDHLAATRRAVLASALPHVAHDGWSDRTLAWAVEDAGVDAGLARLAFPRGGVDLALAWHRAKDAELAEALAASELQGLRFRDRIAFAIIRRLEIVAPDREAVLRGASLFALPTHAAEGARAIWHTADTIWTALGDESNDYNWYTKRTTLAAVYSAALLYWLGDQSPGFANTRDFVHRRIDNVMQIEGMKAQIRKNPIAAAVLAGPRRLLDRVRAPGDTARPDLPGSLHPKG